MLGSTQQDDYEFKVSSLSNNKITLLSQMMIRLALTYTLQIISTYNYSAL